MLPTRLDATGVKPAGAVSPSPAAVPVADARQAALQRTLGSLVGQSMQGQVLSNYHDGSSLVRVAGASVRMLLPPGTQVGAELPMTLLSVTPRPTFQVGNPQAAQALPLYSDTGLGAGAAQPETAGDAAQLLSQTPLPGRAQAEGAQGRAQSATGGAGQEAALTGEAADLPESAGAGAGKPAATAATPGQAQATPSGAAGAAAAQAAANAAAAAVNQQAAARAGAAAGQAPGAAQEGAPGQAAAQSGAAGNAANATPVRPQSLAATLLAKAPLTPADQLPDLSHDTPAPALSQTARSIASALANAYHTPGTPPTINGKTPLVADGAPEPQQLAKNLQNALGHSGLFYESHVAEWAEGKRGLQDLQREPQMQRSNQAGGPQTAETLARAAQAAPDLSAAQMINQQLHAHEQQRVQWQGEAWPGQPMQWEVRRDEADARDGQDRGGRGEEGDGEPIWRSGVRFNLPTLGKVAASVTLAGNQVHVQLQAGTEDSAETMRAWAGLLQQALEAAGSPLASLAIHATGARDGE